MVSRDGDDDVDGFKVLDPFFGFGFGFGSRPRRAGKREAGRGQRRSA